MARSQVAEALVRTLTLAPGIAPLGLLFGAAAVAAGFSPAAAVALSALVFAGGAQFAAVGLAASGVLAAVALAAVINSRYLLLSAATLEIGRKAGARRGERVLLALGTVDESFALQAAWAKEALPTAAGLLLVPAFLWSFWVGSTLVGALAGSLLPDLAPWGLDYALPGIFVGLLGIFADSTERLVAGLSALALAAVLALLGWGVVAVLVVPPTLAFAWGAWRRAG